MTLHEMSTVPNPHRLLLSNLLKEKLHDIRAAAKDLVKVIGDDFNGSTDSDEFFQAYDNLTVSLAQYDALCEKKKNGRIRD